MSCPQRIGTSQLALKLQIPSSVIPSSLLEQKRGGSWNASCSTERENSQALENSWWCFVAVHEPILDMRSIGSHLYKIMSKKTYLEGRKASDMNKNCLSIKSKIEVLYTFIDHLKIQSVIWWFVFCASHRQTFQATISFSLLSYIIIIITYTKN